MLLLELRVVLIRILPMQVLRFNRMDLECAQTEKVLRPCSQQARQLTPRRGTVAHLGNRVCCVLIHAGNLSAQGEGDETLRLFTSPLSY